MLLHLSSSPIFSSPKNSAIFVVVLFSLMHLFTMGQIELTNDEAQYALYGYYLDWSYFDHPPLAGWMNAFILQLSDSDFALRIWPLLLSILTSFLLYGFTRDLFTNESAWVATIAVLLYQASVITQVFSLAMLPDTPLIPISISAIWLLHRTLNKNQPHLWLYIGILFGLAGLAKYTAVTLVVTAILFLIINKNYKILFSLWPWSAMLLATIFISPIIYWNIQHDWISISYQLNHGAPDKPWLIENFFISQASQLITYTPIIYIAGLISIISTLKNKNLNEKYILAFSLPVLILFNWNSGYEQTLPHWTALGWIALTPLIAKWLVSNWNKKSVRIFSYMSIIYSLMLSVGFHLALASSIIPFDENKHPLEELYGWEKVAERAVTLQKNMHDKNAVIFVGNWSQFSRLAWYARPAVVQITDDRYGQSDIWYNSPKTGSNGILVVPPKYKDSVTSGLNNFERCENIETVTELLNDKIAASYQLYQCYGYKG